MTVQLSENDVHVWYCRCDDPAVVERFDDYMLLLSPDEQERRSRFRFEEDRQLFLVSHALLRAVLSQYAPVAPTEWKFQQTAKGKPLVAADAGLPALQFNLSHTANLAACAVTRTCPVGVDVESLDRHADPKVAQRVLTPSELKQFQEAAPRQQKELFFRYWTLKESYVKAVGLGLAMSLREISFVLSETNPPAIVFSAASSENARAWQFHQQPVDPHYFLAVTVARPTGDPARFRVLDAPPPL